MLQIPATAKKELDVIFQSSGDSKASFTLDGEKLLPGHQIHNTEGDVGWVCKSCRFVYSSSNILECHQKMLSHNKGILRLAQVMYACKKCGKSMSTFKDYTSHLASEHQLNTIGEIRTKEKIAQSEKVSPESDKIRQTNMIWSDKQCNFAKGGIKDPVNIKQDTIPKVEQKTFKDNIEITQIPAEKILPRTASTVQREIDVVSKLNQSNMKCNPEPTKVPMPKILGDNLKDRLNIRMSNHDNNCDTNDCNKIQYSEHRISCESNPSYKEPYNYDSIELNKISSDLENTTAKNIIEKSQTTTYCSQQFESNLKDPQLLNFSTNYNIDSNLYNHPGDYNYHNNVFSNSMNQNPFQYAANFQTDYSPYQINVPYSQQPRQSCSYADNFTVNQRLRNNETPSHCFSVQENQMRLESVQDEISINLLSGGVNNSQIQGDKCSGRSDHITEQFSYPFVINNHVNRSPMLSDNTVNMTKLISPSAMQSTSQ